MQTCPGFFLKSFLESLGNLLEICSVKFVDITQQAEAMQTCPGFFLKSFLEYIINTCWVSTWTGDHLWVDTSRYVTSHLGQLSLPSFWGR